MKTPNSVTKKYSKVHLSTEASNTIKASAHRSWCFTLNNYTEEEANKLDKKISTQSTLIRGCCQEEVGDEKTPHLQGVITFNRGQTLTFMKKINERAHWEPTRNLKASLIYCSRPDKRSGRIWCWNYYVKEPIEDPMKGLEFKQWQLDILKLIETKPNRRDVHWYYEFVGNTGKSVFTTYLVDKHEAFAPGGSSKDILYGFAALNKKKDVKIVVIDIPREVEIGVSYDAIEKLKNGLFYQTKYECEMVRFNPPHVIVFSNFPPREGSLSEDRIQLHCIEET